MFHAGSGGLRQPSRGLDLLLIEPAARKAQSQRELQVFHRSQNLRCGATAASAAGLDHAGEESIDGTVVGVEESPTLRGNLVQLLRTVAGTDRHVTKLLKEGQSRIDDARARAVGSGDLLLNRLDKLIAVPALLGDEMQDDQAKVAVGEEAAEASSASLPTMLTTAVVVVLQPNPLDFVLRLAVRTCDHKAWSCAGIACVRARRHWRDRR